MDKDVHNIEHEKKLIEMLGYNLIGPDNSNRWLVVDENSKNVGFIQYKTIVNKNVKKGLSAIHGYHTEIDSPIIKYNETRKLQIKNDFFSYFSYEFDIKRENGTDHIKISVGDYPSLILWSKEHGFISFSINSDRLSLNYKSKTENFNIEESVTVELLTTNKAYEYCLSYCDIDKDISSADFTSLHISFSTIENYVDNKSRLRIKQRKWKNRKFLSESSSIVDGTIKDAIVSHKMGIDSFNHFRYLINQILPFKEEVIAAMLEKRGLKELEFSIFMSDLDSDVKKLQILKK